MPCSLALLRDVRPCLRFVPKGADVSKAMAADFEGYASSRQSRSTVYREMAAAMATLGEQEQLLGVQKSARRAVEEQLLSQRKGGGFVTALQLLEASAAGSSLAPSATVFNLERVGVRFSSCHVCGVSAHHAKRGVLSNLVLLFKSSFSSCAYCERTVCGGCLVRCDRCGDAVCKLCHTTRLVVQLGYNLWGTVAAMRWCWAAVLAVVVLAQCVGLFSC